MRAGGRQRSWSASPTGTLTCMTRRSTLRFNGCGARRDQSQPAAAALQEAARGPGWATDRSPARAGPAAGSPQALSRHRKRQAIPAAALAPDDDLAGTPVDVVEREAESLATAQPEPAQQQDDGVIPA